MHNTIQEPKGPQAVEGILRAVDLDRGRLVVRDQHARYNVEGVDDTMDDIIGAMVNRQVIVQADAKSSSKLLYKAMAVADSNERSSGMPILFDD